MVRGLLLRTGCLKVIVNKVKTTNVCIAVAKEGTFERVTNRMRCNLEEHKWYKSDGLEATP